MKYDLHIHSCLSPCANNDMTPANIAGFAKLNGIDIIAVTDHNAANNLPAVQAACETYGVKLLPGIEVNTAEDIHILTYFPTVEKALAMGAHLYKKLPQYPFDKNIWGQQLVMNTEDTIIGEVDKLLTGAVSLTIYEVETMCRQLGGITIPAHVDREAYSLLSVLGFAPEDIPFEAFELRNPQDNLEMLVSSGRLPPGKEILTSSDAHALQDISENPQILSQNSILYRLIKQQ